MDVIVTPAEGGTVWQLTDLLGRSMGRITASAPRQFMIHPEGHASETMAGIQQGPHASLDAALAEIERHTRGVCRRNPCGYDLYPALHTADRRQSILYLLREDLYVLQLTPAQIAR